MRLHELFPTSSILGLVCFCSGWSGVVLAGGGNASVRVVGTGGGLSLPEDEFGGFRPLNAGRAPDHEKDSGTQWEDGGGLVERGLHGCVDSVFHGVGAPDSVPRVFVVRSFPHPMIPAQAGSSMGTL